MKIGFVCNEYPPMPHGGIGSFVQAIAHGLAAAGHEVRVYGIGERNEEWNDGAVRVRMLAGNTLRGISWCADRLKLFRMLRQEVRRGALDVIEVPDYLGPFLFRFRSCPVVVRLHLASSTIRRHRGARFSFVPWLCESANLRVHRNWIAVSEYSLELTKETFETTPDQSRVIYYPVTLPEDQEPARNLPSTFVLFAGSISVRKGALDLARAANVFLDAHKDCKLVFLGRANGEDGSSIHHEVTGILRADLRERVQFHGQVSRRETLAYMRRASAFAFPSTLETFGLVVAEAMLAGCPVVTCNLPPFTEFVEHGKTGLLVEPGDIGALAYAVNLILADPCSAKAIALRAQKEVAARFSLNTAVAQTLSFYKDVCRRNGAATELVEDMI